MDNFTYLQKLKYAQTLNENEYTEKKIKQIKIMSDDIKNIENNIITAQHELNRQMYKSNSNSDTNLLSLPIRTIKSNYNNQYLSTIPIDPDTYQINLNNQCITVYNKDNVVLKKCQENININDGQKFTTERINYPSISSNKLMLINNVTYPYNIFRSNLTNQCLTLNDDGDILLKDCYPDNIKQHWKISPNEFICPT